jgi:hypothetical protein
MRSACPGTLRLSHCCPETDSLAKCPECCPQAVVSAVRRSEGCAASSATMPPDVRWVPPSTMRCSWPVLQAPPPDLQLPPAVEGSVFRQWAALAHGAANSSRSPCTRAPNPKQEPFARMRAPSPKPPPSHPPKVGAGVPQGLLRTRAPHSA